MPLTKYATVITSFTTITVATTATAASTTITTALLLIHTHHNSSPSTPYQRLTIDIPSWSINPSQLKSTQSKIDGLDKKLSKKDLNKDVKSDLNKQKQLLVKEKSTVCVD